MTDPGLPDAIAAAMLGNERVAIIYADANGNIRFWNAGAVALFGHSVAEVAGRRVDLIVPAAYRAMHWAGFNRTIGTAWRGADAWGAIDGLHKSGNLVPLEVLLTPMFGADGLVEGVMAMFRQPA